MSVRCTKTELVRRRGPVTELLRPWWPDRAVPAIAVFEVTGAPTLVLGSTQGRFVLGSAARTGSYEELRADVEPQSNGGPASGEGNLTRRASGGGAVLVSPGAQVWIEVFLPRGHPLWRDDVVLSGLWIGEAWADAFRSLGSPETALVHRGRLSGGSWSKVVCFAGLGPGEVTVGGRKVVGIAQRRDRGGARFQTTSPLVWDPVRTLGALASLGIIESAGLSDGLRREISGDISREPLPSAVADLRNLGVGLREVTGSRWQACSDESLLEAVASAVVGSLGETLDSGS